MLVTFSFDDLDGIIVPGLVDASIVPSTDPLGAGGMLRVETHQGASALTGISFPVPELTPLAQIQFDISGRVDIGGLVTNQGTANGRALQPTSVVDLGNGWSRVVQKGNGFAEGYEIWSASFGVFNPGTFYLDNVLIVTPEPSAAILLAAALIAITARSLVLRLRDKVATRFA